MTEWLHCSRRSRHCSANIGNVLCFYKPFGIFRPPLQSDVKSFAIFWISTQFFLLRLKKKAQKLLQCIEGKVMLALGVCDLCAMTKSLRKINIL